MTMADTFQDASIEEITDLLKEYLDGLHDGDLDKFDQVFHENSHLYASDGSTLTDMSRDQYFDLIKNRESPRGQGLARYDRIVSIHKAGPNTAHAIVNCAIPPRYFTDYLTLLRTADGWRIISKTYHVDTHE